MDKVEIKDYSKLIKTSYRKAREQSLEKIGLVAEGKAKRLCPVDTGRLRNSIAHAVSGESKTISYKTKRIKGKPQQEYTYTFDAPSDDTDAVYIGTNVEYAPIIEARDHFLLKAATENRRTYQQIIKAEFESIK